MRIDHVASNYGPEEHLSQLKRHLTEREENGTIARKYGLLQDRTHQAGLALITNRDHRHVAFIHPPLCCSPPMPSARRAAPRRPETCG